MSKKFPSEKFSSEINPDDNQKQKETETELTTATPELDLSTALESKPEEESAPSPETSPKENSIIKGDVKSLEKNISGNAGWWASEIFDFKGIPETEREAKENALSEIIKNIKPSRLSLDEEKEWPDINLNLPEAISIALSAQILKEEELGKFIKYIETVDKSDPVVISAPDHQAAFVKEILSPLTESPEPKTTTVEDQVKSEKPSPTKKEKAKEKTKTKTKTETGADTLSASQLEKHIESIFSDSPFLAVSDMETALQNDGYKVKPNAINRAFKKMEQKGILEKTRVGKKHYWQLSKDYYNQSKISDTDPVSPPAKSLAEQISGALKTESADRFLFDKENISRVYLPASDWADWLSKSGISKPKEQIKSLIADIQKRDFNKEAVFSSILEKLIEDKIIDRSDRGALTAKLIADLNEDKNLRALIKISAPGAPLSTKEPVQTEELPPIAPASPSSSGLKTAFKKITQSPVDDNWQPEDYNQNSTETTPDSESEKIKEGPTEEESIKKEDQVNGTPPAPESVSSPESSPNNINKILSNNLEQNFGISPNQYPPEYQELSPGQKALALEKLRHATLSEVKSEAESTYSKELNNTKNIFKRLFKKATRGFALPAKEKEAFSKIKDNNDHNQNLLKQISSGIKDINMEVIVKNKEDAGDKLQTEIQFTSFLENKDNLPEETISNFNRVANSFSRVPYEWSFSSDKNERRAFEESLSKYESVKAKILDALSASVEGGSADTKELKAIHLFSRLDGLVNMERFLSHHPDVDLELARLQENNSLKQIIQDKSFKNIRDNLGYFTLGFGVRSATIGALGFIGAPLTAAGLAGFSSFRKARQEIKDREAKSRYGGESVDVSSGYTNASDLLGEKEKLGKIDETLQKIDKINNEIEQKEILYLSGDGQMSVGNQTQFKEEIIDLQTKKQKNLEFLRLTVDFTESKINAGLINFGHYEKIKQRYDLQKAVFAAHARLEQEDYSSKVNQEMRARLDRLLSLAGHDLEKERKDARFKLITRRVLTGSTIAATFASLGWWARDLLSSPGSISDISPADSPPTNSAPSSSEAPSALDSSPESIPESPKPNPEAVALATERQKQLSFTKKYLDYLALPEEERSKLGIKIAAVEKPGGRQVYYILENGKPRLSGLSQVDIDAAQKGETPPYLRYQEEIFRNYLSKHNIPKEEIFPPPVKSDPSDFAPPPHLQSTQKMEYHTQKDFSSPSPDSSVPASAPETPESPYEIKRKHFTEKEFSSLDQDVKTASAPGNLPIVSEHLSDLMLESKAAIQSLSSLREKGIDLGSDLSAATLYLGLPESMSPAKIESILSSLEQQKISNTDQARRLVSAHISSETPFKILSENLDLVLDDKIDPKTAGLLARLFADPENENIKNYLSIHDKNQSKSVSGISSRLDKNKHRLIDLFYSSSGRVGSLPNFEVTISKDGFNVIQAGSISKRFPLSEFPSFQKSPRKFLPPFARVA